MAKTISNKWIVCILVLPTIVLLNYVTSIITDLLHVPFFLDTWATSLGVMMCGLLFGIIGGVLYNLFMAFTFWGASAWVWSISSIWVAIVTYFLWKSGWIKIGNPFKIIGSGMFIGATNAIVTTLISVIAFGALPTYAGTEPTYQFFYAMTNNRLVSTLSEHLITELADKTIAIFMAAFVFTHLPWRKK